MEHHSSNSLIIAPRCRIPVKDLREDTTVLSMYDSLSDDDDADEDVLELSSKFLRHSFFFSLVREGDDSDILLVAVAKT